MPPKRLHWFAVLVALLAISSCMTPDQAIATSDARAGDIVAAKQKALFGESRPFDVKRPESRMHTATLDHATGLATRPAPLELSIHSILDLAARNSREFQTERERLWRSALALASEQEDFTSHPFARLGTETTDSPTGTSTSGDAQIGVSQLLKRGGSFLLTAGGSFLTFGQGAGSSGTLLGLSLAFPLLRGAGEDAILENLRQADRDALYALRDFERYKQRFAVDVEIRFLRLLSSSNQVGNEERNLERLRMTRERNEALAEAQRMTVIQVDQARQTELDGQSRLVLARNRLQNSLDDFKEILGLPVDLVVTIDAKELASLDNQMSRSIPVDETKAMQQGLKLRLDLQNIRDDLTDTVRKINVAENALEPDLTLGLTGSVPSGAGSSFRPRFENGTYRGTVDVDLGLYRNVEAFRLKIAHLNRESALRAIEGYEDVVKSEIRLSLRNLEQARTNYTIQQNAVSVAVRRVESVNEFILRGDEKTRDLLEAQSSLVRAENSLSDALVDYRSAFLSFYRDTGALVVRPEGLDHETSDELLLAP